MSVSDLGEKNEWGADSEPRKNERVPSSAICTQNAVITLATSRQGPYTERVDLCFEKPFFVKEIRHVIE